MASSKMGKSEVEWVGGLAEMPADVIEEGELSRPQVLLWMIPDGPVLGLETAPSGTLLAQAGTHLRHAMTNPLLGTPHGPDRIRVASPELAAAIRDSLPEGTELVCAPTPEIDDALASLAEFLELADAPHSYLAPETDPEAMASWFRAMARLFRAKPWSVVPAGIESVLSVTIESLGVHDSMLSIMETGDRRGLLLFSSADDHVAYLEGMFGEELDEAALEDGPEMPPHFALDFASGAELSPELRKEVTDHGWEIAGEDAYPWLLMVEEEHVDRPPSSEERTITEAIALALPELLEDKEQLVAAWDGGEPFARTLQVKTHAGEMAVTLRVDESAEARKSRPVRSRPPEDRPLSDRPFRDRPLDDLLADLLRLEQESDEIDHDARGDIEDELLTAFGASPEAEGLEDLDSCEIMMDLAARHLGTTIATMEARDLAEVMFEILPHKVAAPASRARHIIEENRAFFRWLKRELSLEHADACLEVLGDDAIEELEAALSDPSDTAGLMKTLLENGRKAGFAVDTPEGLAAWVQHLESSPTTSSGLPMAGGSAAATLSPAAKRAKKNQRKAARKARKKNR